jgi:putative DNA primase/helicase
VSDQSQQRLAPPETSDGVNPEIARLAALDPIAYDRERLAAAEELGCRVSTLDSLVAKARAEADEHKQVDLCADVDPCAEPVDVGELLDDIDATIRRFIICDDSTRTAAVLWIAFTWIIEHAQVSPLAIITAPEKGCGKSQLLDVIGRLSKRPLFASNISPAATFRVIEAKTPTLLIDEADAFFKENEELRGIINSGHTRTSAYVIRTVGDDFEVKQFSTWGAKAIAGIGRLPETVMSRGIILALRRKLKSETVERLRHAKHGLFDALAGRLARFGQDYGAAIARARPQLPEALGDREQDNWEHLLAIADLAGGSWPQEVRRAALMMCGANDREDLSLGEQLLHSIRDAFGQDVADKLSREELLRRLVADEEGPWATWNKGKPMSAAQFRKRLAAYAIKTKKVRLDTYTTAQGFERRQFEDAWSRYLDGEDHASTGSTPQNQNNGTSQETEASGRSEAVPVPVRESEHADSAVNSSPVPKSKWNGNANGTAKKTENLDCSNVPVPIPTSGEDTPHEIEVEL